MSLFGWSSPLSNYSLVSGRACCCSVADVVRCHACSRIRARKGPRAWQRARASLKQLPASSADPEGPSSAAASLRQAAGTAQQLSAAQPQRMTSLLLQQADRKAGTAAWQRAWALLTVLKPCKGGRCCPAQPACSGAEQVSRLDVVRGGQQEHVDQGRKSWGAHADANTWNVCSNAVSAALLSKRDITSHAVGLCTGENACPQAWQSQLLDFLRD